MTEQIKLLIAEDRELTRLGLSMSLQKKASSIQIVAEVESGDLALLEAGKLSPNVILMDINMLVLDGIEGTTQIKVKFPQIKVIMLTSHDSGDKVYASLAAGADAYCLKDIKLERLIQVIEMVNEGALWLDHAIAQMVVKALPLNLPERLKTPSSSNRNHYNLVPTERGSEVLEK